MKRKYLLSLTMVAAFSMLMISLSSNAQDEEEMPGEGNKKVEICTKTRQDTIVSVGSTCPEGTEICRSNPCD
ncbi:MAG: hypothetical protein J0I32_09570 [Sphingobacteriales bacterium]|nr:hypothetical protein [Sphingobacteriales bacterium]OJW00248.1 MAG: hypothetical protein BGO52_03945 [Sphingobacteriales bacterium 44-61]